MALSKSLALTYAPYGITVNNIPPWVSRRRCNTKDRLQEIFHRTR